MGKQSARLYYQGKDHKDIYFRGKYHGKMYKGGQLLWEKLFPDEYFVLIGTNQGVGVLSKSPKFYDMLPSAYDITVIGNVGQTLIGYCKIGMESADMIFSNDYGKSWKKFDISVSVRTENITTYFRPSSRSFAFVDSDGAWSIARFDEDGNFINSVQTDFKFFANTGEYSYGIVRGYAEYYSFWRTTGDRTRDREIHIRNVDQNGNDVGGGTYKTADSSSDMIRFPISLYHAGTSIYGIMGGDSMFYDDTYIIRLDEISGTYAWIKRYDYLRLYRRSILYFDDNKTIVISQYRENGYTTRITHIHVFSSDSYQLILDSDDGLISVRSKDGEGQADISITNFYANGNSAVLTISDGSCMYIKNDHMSADDSNGICFYSTMRLESNGEVLEKRCVIYFDNIYLKESDGNYYELIC